MLNLRQTLQKYLRTVWHKNAVLMIGPTDQSYYPNTTGGTIPGRMHRSGETSGRTLPLSELEIKRRWKSKLAAGGYNPGEMPAATN